ncbi:MAG: type II toxin-antitoxin system mRNA interferase toxin, RelE/StbE family [Caldilineaceae bacterium]|nr:type II toxin-antitoxin system mRNA interferase toxin, RelE/StbE family [Caldilineaceae bacterium]
MIKSIKHRGLKRLYKDGDGRGLSGNMRHKVEEILTVLDSADSIEEADVAGYRLYPLTGNLKGYWSVRVTGNWRIIFRFEEGSAEDVDLVDYH